MAMDAQNMDVQSLCEASFRVPHIAPAESHVTSASVTQVGTLPSILQLVNGELQEGKCLAGGHTAHTM